MLNFIFCLLLDFFLEILCLQEQTMRLNYRICPFNRKTERIIISVVINLYEIDTIDI